ncbi:Fic family protein [Sedimentisphaera salicampi]|uniref:Fic family protein n=1 Tax=Sedimentisphaera salicampi TaxID=1941349 RepID=UPI000B9B9DBC|nr:RNA-binding domain-containing protein [Sedimentisphaera salicampi]OXU14881.1 Divergent AAA domain protein [Sedimentisphaera salicampi]
MPFKETNRIEFKRNLADSLEKEVTAFLNCPEGGNVYIGIDEDEFFEGYSIPRNKELMRIYKDLDIVEYLGSGMPRIMQYYPRDCFKFTNHFLRMTIFNEERKVEAQSEAQSDSILSVLEKGELSPAEITKMLQLKSKSGAFKRCLSELLTQNLIEMTIPEKPNSRLQKYRLTEKGKKYLETKGESSNGA